MKVPDIKSPFLINNFSGKFKIRKEFGDEYNRYVFSMDRTKPLYVFEDDILKLAEWIKENKDS